MSDTLTSATDTGAVVGPLEARHLRLTDSIATPPIPSRLTSTHWHIAWANGLGWGFDGMDGAILALVAPLLMKEFAIDLGTYRSGVQIASLISIIGLYLWPWLADRFGRRNILALNIAVFSLAMPLVALSPTWGSLRCGLLHRALRAERRMGGRLDAGRGDLAGPAARPRAQRRPLRLGSRRRARRHDRDLRGDRYGAGERPSSCPWWSRSWRSMSGCCARNRRIGCARRTASSASPSASRPGWR